MPVRSQPITTTAALARHLGLSRTTVSRALNAHPKVHPDTRRAVEEAMRSLGFAPSATARSLRGARTRLVGICLRYLGIPIYIQKVDALCTALRAGGWRPSVELLDAPPERWSEVAAHYASMRAEGVIFVGPQLDPAERACIDLLEARGIPTVLLDPLRHAARNIVSLDRRKAMRLLAGHLLAAKHRHFGLIGITGEGPTAVLRRDSFAAALREHGRDPARCVVEFPTPAIEPRVVQSILSARPRPTALVAINDRVALHILNDLRRAGQRVPEDFAVVGFDNLDAGATSYPSLTTIDHNVPELARHTVEMLQRRMAHARAAPAPSELITPRLVIRESTGGTRSPA